MRMDGRLDLLEPAGVDPRVIDLVTHLITEAADEEVSRLNALELACRHGLPTHRVIEGLLHASRVGLLEMHWNVACPGCGGILDAGTGLQSFAKSEYPCSLCASSYEPNVDELVEVVFSLSPSVRRLPIHDPDTLGYWEFLRQSYFSSGLDLPKGAKWDHLVQQIALEDEVLAPDERATLSFHLPAEFLILFEPITHTTHFLDVQGEPTTQRQELSVTYAPGFGGHSTFKPRPGPVRLVLENRSGRRLLPGVFRANDELHDMMARRRPFLTAKHVMTNQAFRELYKADALSIDQRLRIASLTVLFTDLRGSTELYDRVGDLMAYELVRSHFDVLAAVVREHEGAVVKTIGDAVMATFATPRDGVAAALGMHRAMTDFNRSHARDDLVLKIGLHEGPCLAVTLNDRLDYFGQTVNISARVQGLAGPQTIYATEPVVSHDSVREVLATAQIAPVSRRASLKGVTNEMTIYEISPRAV